jgi:hypothetical protein
MLQYRRLLLIDATHFAKAGTLMQTSRELIEPRRRTYGVDFHAPIVQIARVARKT